MSRELPPESPEGPDDGPPGHVQVTGPGPLVGFGVVGLVAGWAIRPLTIRMGVTEPEVSWLSIGLIFFVAAIIGGAAYLTWQTLHRRGEKMLPHQAVNRLVLGKACALAGAALAGGYFGFALAHLGISDSEAVRARFWHAVVAGIGGLLVVGASLLLEHACRVRSEDD